MLEAIGAGSAKQVGPQDWADKWLESPEFATVKEEITQINETALSIPDNSAAEDHRECTLVSFFPIECKPDHVFPSQTQRAFLFN